MNKTETAMTFEERIALDREIASIFEGEERYDEMLLLASVIGEAGYVADLAAYIRVAQAAGKHKIEIQFNVAHDLRQYGRPGFVPRTHGYAKREQD